MNPINSVFFSRIIFFTKYGLIFKRKQNIKIAKCRLYMELLKNLVLYQELGGGCEPKHHKTNSEK